LWDMHVHGASDARAPWSHLLFLANGVVGVRDALRRLPTKNHRQPSTSAVPSLMVQIPSGPNPLLSPMKRMGAK
jgi:hypothetical protein